MPVRLATMIAGSMAIVLLGLSLAGTGALRDSQLGRAYR